MREELTRLAPLFDDFISQLDAFQISYQVGVITTDLTKDQGILKGSPWIITRETQNANEVFAANIQTIIDDPASLSQEEGLASILAALSDDLLEAGASNYGFLRTEAGLSIIAVSDANDVSQAPDGVEDVVGYYVDALTTIKGGDTRDRLLFSAIVGPEPNGCGALGGLFATAGTRYIDMAERLNGVSEPICTSDFAAVVSSFGADQVVQTLRFPLAHMPLESSIRVTVNTVQQLQDAAWYLDLAGPAVVFYDESAPPYGANIQVEYLYVEEE